MTIMMIDDDEDTNLLVGMLLDKYPLVDRYHIQTDAYQALEQIKNNEIEPDCMFVDVTMPQMNGYTFVEKYENLHEGNLPKTCIYMLSSSARESDRKRVNDYRSVKEFILKPLSKRKLYEIAKYHSAKTI